MTQTPDRSPGGGIILGLWIPEILHDPLAFFLHATHDCKVWRASNVGAEVCCGGRGESWRGFGVPRYIYLLRTSLRFDKSNPPRTRNYKWDIHQEQSRSTAEDYSGASKMATNPVDAEGVTGHAEIRHSGLLDFDYCDYDYELLPPTP